MGGGGGGSVGSREDHSCGCKLCRKINLQLLYCLHRAVVVVEGH